MTTDRETREIANKIREVLGTEVGYVVLTFPGGNLKEDKIEIDVMSNVHDREQLRQILINTAEVVRTKEGRKITRNSYTDSK